MTTPSLDDLARLAQRTPAPKVWRKMRTVVRFDRSERQRLDALRPKLGGASRAAIVRVFVLWGLAMVESEQLRAANDHGGAP
jgi:hypothetical protein